MSPRPWIYNSDELLTVLANSTIWTEDEWRPILAYASVGGRPEALLLAQPGVANGHNRTVQWVAERMIEAEAKLAKIAALVDDPIHHTCINTDEIAEILDDDQ